MNQKLSIKQLAEKQNKIQSADSKKFIVIMLVTAIVVAIILIFLLLALKEKSSPKGDKTILKGTFEEKLKTCLEKNLERNECYLMYDDFDTLKICEKLNELRDKCVYKVALANEDKSLCEKINNEELKNKCDEEIIIIMPFEE